jgi:hypothetical protein
MLRYLWVATLILGCSKPDSAGNEAAGDSAAAAADVPQAAVSTQQAAGGATPEAAAQAFGNALKANDWAAAARLMHPDALKQLRALFTPMLSIPGAESMGAELFGARSNADLATLPDTVMFASFLRNVLNQQPGLADAMRTSTFTPLGHVKAEGDTVLVVSRMAFTVEGMTVSQFDVMPFILDEGQWRGLLKADFTNMATMIRRGLAGAPS